MVQSQAHMAHLPLFGTAGLYVAGGRVRLRRKSLALLYYLALEGPTGRAAMAELLWEHASARQNLRVELHELRRALRKLGIAAFEERRDPLMLPPGIGLDATPRAGQALEGLERVSGSYREWLSSVRDRVAQVDERPAVQLHAQATELAAQIDPPFLLIVKGSPLAGFKSFALQLAKELNLPFLEGVEGGATAVRYLPMPQSEEQIRRVLKDQKSVWVLPTAPFGEDQTALLELRAQWPADRASFVTLQPLSWPDAQRGPLRGLPFDEAAQLYLASGGDAAHLKHLLELHRAKPEASERPLPQQVRAAYQRESRFLSYLARLALERISIHPGTFDEGFLQALDAHAHLEELERRGWLAYEDEWRFASEPARRVLYQALQPGRRREYHRAAARYFAQKGLAIARIFHEQRAAGEVSPPEQPPDLEAWAKVVWNEGPSLESDSIALRSSEPKVLDELFLEPPEVQGQGWELRENRFCFVRNGPPFRHNMLVIPGHEEAVLVRLTGRGYVENVLGVGLGGGALPLLLQVGRKPVAFFAPVAHAHDLGLATLLPVSSFDVWIEVPAGVSLRLSSAAERIVLEFELKVYRMRAPHPRVPRIVRMGG